MKEYTPERIKSLIELNQLVCKHQETYLEVSEIAEESHSDYVVLEYKEFCQDCHKYLGEEKQYFIYKNNI